MASSLVAQVVDGKVVDSSASASTSSTGSSKASSSSTSGLDKEAFLQLLIAQMQYQDPLEPMDNTEYVSQLATFSQLEATQNMQDSITQSMANDLVGKYVILTVTDSSGNVSTVSGPVDYVMYEGGETYLAVNDGLYSLDDLDTVADADYYGAVTLANTFSNVMAKLPSASNATVADATSVESARAVYDAMTTYQQGFVSSEDLAKLEELEQRIKELTGSSSTDETVSEASAEETEGSEDTVTESA